MAKLQELEVLAQNIGARGASDDAANGALSRAVTDLSKGMSSAITDIVSLLKGKGFDPIAGQISDTYGAGSEGGATALPSAAHTKPSALVKADQEEEEEEVEGEGEGEGEGDGEGGFSDMNLGEDFMDVTALVVGLARTNAALAKDNKEIRFMMKGMQASLAEQSQLTMQVLHTQIMTTAPLAKAQQEFLTLLGNMPEQSVGLQRPTARALARNGVVASKDLLGGSVRSQKQILAKGMAKGIISEEQVRHYTHTGKFSPDDAAHAAIVTTLQA